MRSHIFARLTWAVSFLIGLNSIASAQVVKDTLAGKYGPHTVWETTAYDDQFKNIDTSIHNIYQTDPKLEFRDFYQDLGSFGSAYRTLHNLGQTNGVFKELSEDHYDNYGLGQEGERKFYTTLSPFAKLRYQLGGIGDVLFDGIYTRNINPGTNFGFEFRRLKSNQLFPLIGDDALINSTSLRLFGSYFAPNKKYKLFADYHSTDYNSIEQGGIDIAPTGLILSWFDWGNINARLDASSKYEDRSYFLYHEYMLDKGIGLYHEFNGGRKKHKYTDNSVDLDSGSTELLFYPTTVNIYAGTYHKWSNTSLRNEFGLKGTLGKIWYKAGIHQRFYWFEDHIESNNVKQEIALQARGGFDLNDSTKFKLDFIQSSTGAFQYKASIKHPLFMATGFSNNSLPFYIYERFTSNHYNWDNTGNLRNVYSIGFNAHLTPLKSDKLKLSLGYRLIDNYIYFDNQIQVQQESGAISVLTPSVDYKFKYKKLGFETSLQYNAFTGNRILGLPNVNGMAKSYYALKLFKGALKTNVGAEIRTWSDYQAYGYMPVLHSFYHQDEFNSYATPYLTGFFDFRIKTVTMFIRGENLLEYIHAWNFQTPYYPMKPLNVSFGVQWNFYD